MENRDVRDKTKRGEQKTANEKNFEISELLLEMPSADTFENWIEEGKLRRRKRIKKRMLMSTAAVFVVCFGTLMSMKLVPMPSVEAEPDNTIEINSSMETTTEYKSWDALPEDVKEEFIEITVFPEGYEVEKIVVEDGKGLKKLDIHLINQQNEDAYIREILYTNGNLNNFDIASKGETIEVEKAKIYVEEYDKECFTYRFICRNLAFEISTEKELMVEYLQELIKTVQ